jgi:hypothetical protein
MPTNRRFPPPWSIEDIGAAFVVKDNGGQSSAIFITRRSPADDQPLVRKKPRLTCGATIVGA